MAQIQILGSAAAEGIPPYSAIAGFAVKHGKTAAKTSVCVLRTS